MQLSVKSLVMSLFSMVDLIAVLEIISFQNFVSIYHIHGPALEHYLVPKTREVAQCHAE